MGACTQMIVVRVSPCEYEHIESVARLLRTSISEVARQAMNLAPESEVHDRPVPSNACPRRGSEFRCPSRRP
jgi:hypothetical protein